MQVPLGPSRFPTLVWHRAALVGLALLKFLTPPPPPPRAGTDRDRPSLRASLLRPKLGTSRKLGSFRARSIRALPMLVGGLLCAGSGSAVAQAIDKVELKASPFTIYKIGDAVEVDVTFDSAIPSGQSVGTPSLALRFTHPANVDRDAACSLQQGREVLRCTYRVVEGDQGEISISGTGLHGGSPPTRTLTALTQLAGNEAAWVDGARLKVSTWTPSSAGPYKVGDVLGVTVDFGKDTSIPDGITDHIERNVVDGNEFVPTSALGSLGMTLHLSGSVDRVMQRSPVRGNQHTATFYYTVQAGDASTQLRVSLTNVDGLKDRAGNTGLAGDSTQTIAQAIEGTRPKILSVRVTEPMTSTTPIKTGGAVTLNVEFNRSITSSAPVRLDVKVGSETEKAVCPAVSEATSMTCTLTVPSDDDWEGQLSIPANPFTIAGNVTIRDAAENDLDVRFAGTRLDGFVVDGVPPEITSVAFESPSANARVKIGTPVTVAVNFSEDVALSTGSQYPTLCLSGQSGGVCAVFINAPTKKKWRFRYALTGDELNGTADDGKFTLTLPRDKSALLVPAGGGIEDLAGNALITTGQLPERGRTRSLVPTLYDDDDNDETEKINQPDDALPIVEAVYIDPNIGQYKAGESINFKVLFSREVTVAGTVTLPITIGGKAPAGTPPTLSVGDGYLVTAEYQVVADDSGNVRVTSPLKLDEANESVTVTGGWGYKNFGPDGKLDDSEDKARHATTISLRSYSVTATVDNRKPVGAFKILANPRGSVISPRDQKRYYGRNDKVYIELAFDEDVKACNDTAPEVPTLSDVIGSQVQDNVQLLQPTANRKLTYAYTVGSDHVAAGGITIGDPSGNLNLCDLAGNEADLSDAGTSSRDHLVDGTLVGDQEQPVFSDPSEPAPTVSPAGTPRVATSTAVPSSGYYTEGERIRIEIPMTTRVAYTSRPTLIIDFSDNGGGRATANETPPGQNSFTGSILTFDYTVRAGDEGTISVTLNGQFTVEDGTRVVLGGARSLPSSYQVDARSPTLESVRITSNAGADDTYAVGDTIIVTAEFTELVVRSSRTADPTLSIEVGENSRPMTLQSPSSGDGGDTWVFRYAVVAGDNDVDGVAIAANALKGDLEDAAGNEATITHSAVSASTSHKVDTQGPSVTAVAVTGAGDNDLFLEGDTITATVTFDEEVDVARTGTNAVRVQFNIGTSPETATYAGGDGTETLTFTYEVVAGDSGQISLPADALEGEVEDAAGNEAEGTLALSGGPYTVDASAPMLVGAPSISSAPRTGDTYAVDETITLQVSFDEPVMVTGEPRLPMQVGPRLRNIVVYTSGSGTDTLTFSYTVRNGDNDDDGVSVAANALRLPSGVTIQDVNGLTATIEHDPLPDQPGHKVDAIAPGIESVAITSEPASDDAYLIDETIEVTVTFSEDIATDGTPTLDLMVGEGTDSRAAACAQGSASTQLTCSYMVVANDFDPDGISVNENMLKGTITDMVGNPATLTHEALEDDPAHKVYAAAPEAVRTIDRLSLAAGGGTNSLDLTGIFTGFQLSYAAVSSNTNVATATVSGTDLTVVSGMEGTARVTVTASNLAGEASVSFDVLVATDPAETAVLNDALAAIGRSMLSSTASVIGSRFELASTGSQMALGGSRFGGTLSPQMQRFLAGNDPFALEERMSERALFSGSGSQQAYGGGYGLTADRLLTGTSFNMPLNAMGTGDAQFAVWGAGDLQSFEGEPDNGMYDGSSSSGYIGVDARGDGWLAGVSVSRSGAEADYDFDGLVEGRNTGGTLETSVTAFHPYARLEVGADSEVWVIGGFGGGEADLSRTHVTGSQSSDLSMAMAVGGLRRALAMEFGGADLSLRGDAGFLSLETDSGMMAVDGLSASVSRLRLGLEAAWEGESATPFVEVSGRFDGGDGQTGGGLELAGGLRILNPESGFGLEAKGRILAMHTGDGYSESGIGVTASFEPGAAGRGITFRLSPRWGGSADSTDLFWDEVGNVRDASQYAYGLDRAQTWGVDAALGYGFGLRSMPGIVTPFGQMDVTGDQDQRIRVGVRYGLMQGLLGGTQVELSAERVDGEMHRVGETRVLVSGRARF